MSNKPTTDEFVWAISGRTEHLAIVLEERGEKTLIKWSSNGETALVDTKSIIPNSDMGRRGRGRGSRGGGASAASSASSSNSKPYAKKRAIDNNTDNTETADDEGVGLKVANKKFKTEDGGGLGGGGRRSASAAAASTHNNRSSSRSDARMNQPKEETSKRKTPPKPQQKIPGFEKAMVTRGAASTAASASATTATPKKPRRDPLPQLFATKPKNAGKIIGFWSDTDKDKDFSLSSSTKLRWLATHPKKENTGKSTKDGLFGSDTDEDEDAAFLAAIKASQKSKEEANWERKKAKFKKLGRKKNKFTFQGESLQLVLGWLTPDDICSCLKVCKQWQKEIDQNQTVWKIAIHNLWPKLNIYKIVKANDDDDEESDTTMDPFDSDKKVPATRKRGGGNFNGTSDNDDVDYKQLAWRKAVMNGWPGLVSSLEAKKPPKDIQYKRILEGLLCKPPYSNWKMKPRRYNPKPSFQPEDLFLYVEVKDRETKQNIGSWTINFKKIVSWCWNEDYFENHDEDEVDEDEDSNGTNINNHPVDFEMPPPKKGTRPEFLFTICCIRSDTGKSCYLGFEERGDTGRRTIEVRNQINRHSFASTKEGDIAKTLWMVRQQQPGRQDNLDVSLHLNLDFLYPTKLPNGLYRFKQLIGCEFREDTQSKCCEYCIYSGCDDFEGREGFGNKREVDDFLVYLEGLRWH